jgi:RNA polymerase sigma-70 factor, ECF subfamily
MNLGRRSLPSMPKVPVFDFRHIYLHSLRKLALCVTRELWASSGLCSLSFLIGKQLVIYPNPLDKFSFTSNARICAENPHRRPQFRLCVARRVRFSKSKSKEWLVQMPAPTGVTQLLVNWSNGDKAALDEMLPLVYQELRRIAVNRLRQERPNHTLQPTALVNEAYLRLIDQKNVNWQNRAQFFGLAAEMMRRILVNHARHRQAAKRGGGALRVSLEVAVNSFEQKDVNLVALDEALKTLATIDPRQSQIVELKFFGGLTVEEIAEVLQVSSDTIERDWKMARAWLHLEISNR